MTPRAARSWLVIAALLVATAPGPVPASAQSMVPNRASAHSGGEPPWLKCGIQESLDVDFEGNGRPYFVEWRRCGPQRAEWRPDGKTIDYPAHYVTVTRNAPEAEPLVVFDNADEPSLLYIESIRRMRFTSDGRQQLAVVAGIYGTGAAWDLCALGMLDGQLDCWARPGWRLAIAPLMAADEGSWKSRLSVVADDLLLVEALIYDQTRDGNCCPSRGSIFVELRPGNGRFDVGRVWRVPPRKDAR